jgi:protein-L-isoaspartate O-methyltransferase
MSNPHTELLAHLAASLADRTFVKLSLGNYRGSEEQLKQLIAKRILVKREEKLSLTYRYKTRDVVKNYPLPEGQALVADLLQPAGFRVANLYTLGNDWQYEWFGPQKSGLRQLPPSHTEVPPLAHDQPKQRALAPGGKAYLHALGLTDATGEVYKNAQDKYRQINHYIEILRPLLQALPTREPLRVVDMGSGKGYLTFALYDFLTSSLQLPAEVVGVELRPELVEFCNQTAQQAGFSGLHFVPGSIGAYAGAPPQVLIALHACDTATDDALGQGLAAGADLIVVAPCCHKQIRREMQQHKAKNDLDFLTKHGIFMERQAEMVTDGLRALILEYFGYAVKVVEFVSDAHTPKNVLLMASKRPGGLPNVEQASHLQQKIQATKAYFGIGQHYLEKVVGW